MTETEAKTADEVVAKLIEALAELSYSEGSDDDDLIAGPLRELGVAGVESYTDAMVMTRDAGLIVTLADGAAYQLTVVRSR